MPFIQHMLLDTSDSPPACRAVDAFTKTVYEQMEIPYDCFEINDQIVSVRNDKAMCCCQVGNVVVECPAGLVTEEALIWYKLRRLFIFIGSIAFRIFRVLASCAVFPYYCAKLMVWILVLG